MESQRRDFEIFGVKIGSDQVALFGLPALGFLLLNFGALAFYVARYSESFHDDQASDWSLLLRGRVFAALNYTLVLLVPLSAAILTWLQVRDSTPKTQVLSVVVFGTGIFAGLGTWKLRRRVNERQP
jgi:hypothetical protein